MTSPIASAAPGAVPAQKLRRFPGWRIFEISNRLARLVTDPTHRDTLFRRLRNFAYTKRRGSLRLPKYFSAEVRALSDLTKCQVRELMYWVKPSTSLAFPLSKREHQFVIQHSAVPIWNRQSATDSHMAHAVGMTRLGKRDHPSIAGRRLWPSAPSFTEMLEMTRRGIYLSPGRKHLPRVTVEDCLTRRRVSDNIRLASRIVARQIVGLRSSVEIPGQFLPWFRYRNGFSILSIRSLIPAGLVRFLLARWKIRHTDLWLVDHCSLKYYLRKHTASEFIRPKPEGWDSELETVISSESEYYSDSSCSEVSGLSTAARPPPMGVDELIAELFGDQSLSDESDD